MVNDDDTNDEALFRERYATELRKKKQQDSNTFRGDDELNDEKRRDFWRYLGRTNRVPMRLCFQCFYLNPFFDYSYLIVYAINISELIKCYPDSLQSNIR